jgi:hypothetical protein
VRYERPRDSIKLPLAGGAIVMLVLFTIFEPK